jgi:hypothetical protein
METEKGKLNTEGGKKKSKTGLAVAAVFLTGIIFTKGQAFSSNPFYGVISLAVAIGAGWLHYEEKLIKKLSIVRWIVLLIASAAVLGFVSAFLQ